MTCCLAARGTTSSSDGAVSAVNVRLDTGAGYTGEAFGDTLVGIEA
jgi:hypothetical protein